MDLRVLFSHINSFKQSSSEAALRARAAPSAFTAGVGFLMTNFLVEIMFRVLPSISWYMIEITPVELSPSGERCCVKSIRVVSS